MPAFQTRFSAAQGAGLLWVGLAVGLAIFLVRDKGGAARASAQVAAQPKHPVSDSTDRSRGPFNLAVGLEAHKEGRYADAVLALEAALAQGVANQTYARYVLADSLFFESDFGRAARLFAQMSRDRMHPFAARAHWRQADALWQLGHRLQAKKLYQRLLRRPAGEGDPAVALSRLAQLEQMQGLPGRKRAARLLRRLVTEHPAHPLAQSVQRPSKGGTAAVQSRHRAESRGEQTKESEKQTTKPPKGEDEQGAGGRQVVLRGAAHTKPAALTHGQLLERARTLHKQRAWVQAERELVSASEPWPRELRAQRDLLHGRIKYQSRSDYEGAARILLATAPKLPAKDAAWAAFHGARALSRIDRDDEAIKGYHALITRYPRSRWAPEARFLAGWLSFNRGLFQQSLPDLKRAVSDYPSSPFSASAAWHLALSHHFLGQHKETHRALDIFERRAHLRPLIQPRARVSYWRAQSWLAQGHRDKAQEALSALSARDPFGWYGMMAAARLRALDSAFDIAPQLESQSPRLSALPRSVARSRGWRQLREFANAGLMTEAAWQFDRIVVPSLRRLPEAGRLSALVAGALVSGGYARAHRLVTVAGAHFLAANPEKDAARVWRVAFPQAFPQRVSEAAKRRQISPHFLHALMHKESGFDSTVVSYADARGLLQLLPVTAARVAEDLGLDHKPDELWQPAINIELAAAYVGDLVALFKRQILLAAGAYNGGPANMKTWCDRYGAQPLDAFVELVSYSQSREYMKRVARLYALYVYLYEGDRWLPDLKVDCDYRNDGPNY